MDQLTITAKLKAKSGSEDELFEECRKLLEPTPAEEWCTNYEMHRSDEDPGLVMFCENWTNRPPWEKHTESPTCRSSRQTPTTSSRCGSSSRTRR